MIKKYFLAFSLVFLGYTANANNLKIQNVSATDTEVTFTISWDNSWKMTTEPGNYDAVWVFIKVQNCESFDKAWKHAKINATGHTAGGLLQVDNVTDGMGVFVRRTADGFGNIANTVIKLKLQGTYPTSNINFEVHGIEMVYVPQGVFKAGDATSTYTFGSGGASTNTYTISNEDAIAAGDFRHTTVGTHPTYNPIVPAAFPKGYAGFYCMKYEITQGQYVSFLNSINFTQQNSRTARVANNPANTYALGASPTTMSYRNAIRIQVQGNINQPAVYGLDLNANGVYNQADDGENIACNYLNWEDLKAYMDWSALRPMTELEYEKASRGSWDPVAAEKAWGNASITQATSAALSNAGLASELSTAAITVGSGLCAYANAATLTTTGPLRAGFAATPTSYRTKAGASFWGIMEMSGNVWEQTFSVGFASANASGFTGVLGDGELDATGAANALAWGAAVSSTIVRGGSFASAIAQVSISDRLYINAVTYNDNRHQETGGRGVRQF